MYILSNGIKITEKEHEKLCQAIKDDSGRYFYFLDVKTGRLVRVPCGWKKKLVGIKKEPQRFVPLPKVTKEERRERFRYFVEELGVIDVPELQERLSREIKRGATIEELETMLEKDPSGWIHGWVQNEYDFLAEKIEEWLKKPPLNAQDDLDYWYEDNCPVCQLMRKKEEENRLPTLSQTHEAFKKAKKQGVIVGGKLFKDPLDQEIDEMLEMAKSKKFKRGIYNFCDRWCEKCKDTDKCFLFAQEQKRRNRKSSNAKASNDEEIFWEEIKHSFELTRRLIERGLREDGLDPKEVLKEAKKQKEWDDDADTRYDRVKCLISARQYMKDVHNFLDNFHQSRFQFYPELGMEVDFSDIKDEIETINWCHTLLPSKVWRFLYEKESFQREEDEELKKLLAKDLPKYFQLVGKCIQKSKQAWQNLAKKREKLASINSQFIDRLNKIKKEFSKEELKKDNRSKKRKIN